MGTKNSRPARPAVKLCPRNGGGVEEGTLRSPRIWIALLQQGAGRGEMTGAGGLPLPWSRNWQEADPAIMAGQAERIFCVTELGQSRQWSELQCHKLFFFFFRFFDVDHFKNKVFIEICNNTASVLCFHFLAKRHVES